MKLFKILSLLLIINIVMLSIYVPQSNALSKRKLFQIKKLGALAMLMKMQKKKKIVAIPIPIP